MNYRSSVCQYVEHIFRCKIPKWYLGPQRQLISNLRSSRSACLFDSPTVWWHVIPGCTFRRLDLPKFEASSSKHCSTRFRSKSVHTSVTTIRNLFSTLSKVSSRLLRDVINIRGLPTVRAMRTRKSGCGGKHGGLHEYLLPNGNRLPDNNQPWQINQKVACGDENRSRTP